MKSQRIIVALLTMLAHFAYAESVPASDEEDWNAKFQTTYIWQHKPGFNAPYSGQNSLSPIAANSYTFTTDAYIGLRLHKDNELYFVPEVTQGVPFSELVGMGSPSNGELSRVASTNPILYRQQLFLRQTWNQGGHTIKLESGMNQLAGDENSNRFVLTSGNFSTLNIFDNNDYAHDPRMQFMNFSNVTYGAYDYSADARGFGWGIAGEWYRNYWVLRFARMTVPSTPNSEQLDYQIFNHYGDQVEIEHSHTLLDQPGNTRLLLWRNRAVMASYQDAINYGLATHTTPSIFNVRNGDKIKYGYGIDVDQAINADIESFFRAMNSDGRTETLAFLEVDQSLEAGLSVKGTLWQRPLDTVGISLISNGISASRRAYLAAGGISYFIGDGRLNYKTEDIFETYYNWNVMRQVWFTLDYQHIVNPAYNADRGPVQVIGARLHLEY